MNERIKELAQQAELAELYDRYVEYCMKNADDDIMDYDTIVKKFAELFVKECVQTLIDNSPERYTNESAEEDWDKGYDRAVTDCVHHIKEHFGVEL